MQTVQKDIEQNPLRFWNSPAPSTTTSSMHDRGDIVGGQPIVDWIGKIIDEVIIKDKEFFRDIIAEILRVKP
jgi:hypothetical protein